MLKGDILIPGNVSLSKDRFPLCQAQDQDQPFSLQFKLEMLVDGGELSKKVLSSSGAGASHIQKTRSGTTAWALLENTRETLS